MTDAVTSEKVHSTSLLSWGVPLAWEVLATLVKGDSAKSSFWSWPVWWRQSRFFRQHQQPRDLFRNIEYAYAEWALDLQPHHRLADIGTGHTVFAGYIAKRTGASLVAIDYDRYCEEFQRRFLATLGLADYELKFCDATQTDLPDESLDRLLAVSVVEHFPEDGDTRFAREAGRLLKLGGRLVITVPYSKDFREDSHVAHYHGFERRYNLQALCERLIQPSGLSLVNSHFMNLKIHSWPGRKLERKHGSLGQFFGRWYAKRRNMLHERWSVFLTRGLLDIADDPDDTCCGAMLTLEKA